MNSLRDELAEELHYAQGLDDYGVANEDEQAEARALADAVLAFFASRGDVTDDDFRAALRVVHQTGSWREFHALLAAQEARHEAEIAAAKAEAKEWFNEFNELRDKGEPSWDMFDITVAQTVDLLREKAEAERDALRYEIRDRDEQIAAERAALVREVKRSTDLQARIDGALAACKWEMHDGTTSDYEAGQRRAKDDIARALDLP